MDDMYEYLAHRLSEANTVSQLQIFIEKLLTVKQLQYDLLSLLDHYYQVANKVNNHRIYSNSNSNSNGDKNKSSKQEIINNNDKYSSSTNTTTTTTTMTTTTITKITIDSNDGYDLIRSLYLSIAPINDILSNELCTKIISYIPRREYFILSSISKYFNYLIFHDKTAQIYNQSGYQILINDNINLYKNYKYLLLIIHFNNGCIQFIPPNNISINKLKQYENSHDIYVKKIRYISDIIEIPYFGINQWTLSISNECDNDDINDDINDDNDYSKPKMLSFSTLKFQNELESHLNKFDQLIMNQKKKEEKKEEKKDNNDLVLKILENSLNGISCLTLLECNSISRISNDYPSFIKCIILEIKSCKFLNNPSLCLTYNRFPNLQYLELDNISFDYQTQSFKYSAQNIYKTLIETDQVLTKFDKQIASKEIDIDKLTKDLNAATINNNNTENMNVNEGRYKLLMDKILKIYRMIANNFCEWRYINDILQTLNDNECNLLSFSCSMKKSGFVKMIRILLKCVQQRNEYEQAVNTKINTTNNNNTNNNDAVINKKRQEIQKLKRQLLDSQSTLRIPSSIEWLLISNMDCKIDISHCTKIMAIQLNNVRVKQIAFPLLYCRNHYILLILVKINIYFEFGFDSQLRKLTQN